MNSFYGAVKPEQLYITSINLSVLHTKNAVTSFKDNFFKWNAHLEQISSRAALCCHILFLHYTGPLTVSMKMENLTLYTLIIRTKSFKIDGPEMLSIKNFKLFSQPVIRIIFLCVLLLFIRNSPLLAVVSFFLFRKS